jgi:hypothetical protein
MQVRSPCGTAARDAAIIFVLAKALRIRIDFDCATWFHPSLSLSRHPGLIG